MAQSTTDTVFDKIVRGDIPSFKVWESATHLAFLTPFPNTPGFTVVIPKTNQGDDVFELDDIAYQGLMLAAKTVAAKLKKALGVARVGLVYEGTGIPYVHAKLIPMHGDLATQTGVWSKHQEFYPEYAGYLTTVEGPRMSDDELRALQERICGVIPSSVD
jgi:diadenosine tetraphosphate (Ap4A) HIT family hydrolase